MALIGGLYFGENLGFQTITPTPTHILSFSPSPTFASTPPSTPPPTATPELTATPIPTLASTATPAPTSTPTPFANPLITVSGRIETSEGYATQVLFEQVNGFVPLSRNPVTLGPSFTAEVQYDPKLDNYNYTIQLPNNQWFALSVFYETLNKTSVVYHFIQPFRLFENSGVTSKEFSYNITTK